MKHARKFHLIILQQQQQKKLRMSGPETPAVSICLICKRCDLQSQCWIRFPTSWAVSTFLDKREKDASFSPFCTSKCSVFPTWNDSTFFASSRPYKTSFLRDLFLCQKHSMNCCVVATSCISSIVSARHSTCGWHVYIYRNESYSQLFQDMLRFPGRNDKAEKYGSCLISKKSQFSVWRKKEEPWQNWTPNESFLLLPRC